jgi:hypothetical protein
MFGVRFQETPREKDGRRKVTKGEALKAIRVFIAASESDDIDLIHCQLREMRGVTTCCRRTSAGTFR